MTAPLPTRTRWTNWSGTVQATPVRVERPTTVEEVAAVVRRAAQHGLKVRAVGAGHSFTPLAATDDVLLSLDAFSGIESLDAAAGTVTVRAGTRLGVLGDALHARGWALENLGDIDTQSVAGAVSTGTHGTGLGLGSLSTQVQALTLVDGRGAVVTVPPGDERRRAAALALGALGVLTHVTLRVRPAYALHCAVRPARLSDMLALLPEYARSRRHFEFFWVPHTDTVQAKWTHEVPLDMAHERGARGALNELLLENGALWLLSATSRRWPRATPAVCRATALAITPQDRVGAAHRVFRSARLMRFREMEYAVPVAAAASAVRDLRAAFARWAYPVNFPVEVRFVRGDDLLLSPASGGDVAFIAVHTFQGVPHDRYFADAEAIFRAHGGRPHWGKMHGLSAAELSRLYPGWADFQAARAVLDPDGRFVTPYLARLLG
ncbi:D-arabinono-1,4-lactone oxidase [Deinococcus aquaedulcis]|uniref:D-arabinono-1,4-lactone oxidase n=1 Tax=Deinococcus aquaedulcis TaxID=2840455 RepID=UPI001C833814|nr:D-arabinono-1,4-lactone oxidase [Deinococcus aquaedulcis]